MLHKHSTLYTVSPQEHIFDLISFFVKRHNPICVFDVVVPPPSVLTMSGVTVFLESPNIGLEMTQTDDQATQDKH